MIEFEMIEKKMPIERTINYKDTIQMNEQKVRQR
jgi:hypothetical protein